MPPLAKFDSSLADGSVAHAGQQLLVEVKVLRETGIISLHPRGFGFVELHGPTKRAAFVAPPDLNAFLAGDLVSCEVTDSGQGRLAGKHLELLARTRTEVCGQIVARGGKKFLRADKQIANTDWPVETTLIEGVFVVCTLSEGGVLAVRREVAPSDESLERVLGRYGLEREHPAANVALAHTRAPSQGPRRDLRGVTTITIDAPSSRDLDDALSVLPPDPDGCLRVLVSIADVGAWVEEGDPLDLEARRRGTSVYLQGAVLPMLPHELSDERISLLPKVDRLALTCELRIDPEGQVLAVDLSPSIMRSTARLSYDEVRAFLDDGEEGTFSRDILETLRLLRTAYGRIAAVRAARGGVSILRDEAYVSLDAAGRVANIEARGSNTAHALVERLMVLANEAVAQWLVDRGLPGAFRVHDEPTEDRVDSLCRFALESGFEAAFGGRITPRKLAAFEAQWSHSRFAPSLRDALARLLGPARYTATPSQHFGLAAPLYLHFTSPIRRYADLLVHRVVKRYLAGDRDFSSTAAEMEDRCREVNAKALVATRAENERLRMVAARYFAGKVGARYQSVIVAVKPFGLVLTLRGTGVTGSLATEALGPDARLELGAQRVVTASRTYALGSSLEVEIVSANEEQGRIELGLVR